MDRDAVRQLYQRIGEHIRQARERHVPRISQRALAGKIGLSRASLVNIEKGRHRVQIHVLYDLARALDVRLAELLPLASSSIILPSSFAAQLKPKEREAVERLITSKDSTHAPSQDHSSG